MKKCLEKIFSAISKKQEGRNTKTTQSNYNVSKEAESNVRKYNLFGEQYLETPVMAGKGYLMAGITPTICFWRCLPTIDDW
jgi:hypothetical protein